MYLKIMRPRATVHARAAAAQSALPPLPRLVSSLMTDAFRELEVGISVWSQGTWLAIHAVPGILPLACAEARFAPVYVGDVAEAFVRCLDRRDVTRRTFELYGPETLTLGDIVRLTASTQGLRRWVLPLPRAVARVQAAVMDYVPGKPFSTDNFRSALVDSVGERDGLAELGIARTPLRGTVATYLRK